jgi:hypothetical protein
LADASEFLIHLGTIGRILSLQATDERSEYMVALDHIEALDGLGAIGEAVALLAQLIEKKQAISAGELK